MVARWRLGGLEDGGGVGDVFEVDDEENDGVQFVAHRSYKNAAQKLAACEGGEGCWGVWVEEKCLNV